MIVDKKLYDFRKEYYCNSKTKERLLTAFENREVVIMDRTENWKCQRAFFFKRKLLDNGETDFSFMDYWMKFINLFMNDYNIYVSVAKYKFIPFFDMNPANRSKSTHLFFKNYAHNYIFEYDLFYDFDRDKKTDIQILKDDIKKLLVNVIELQYNNIIIPSGKGFNMVVSSNGLFPIQTYNYEHGTHKEIALFISEQKDKYNLTSLCKGGLNLLTRFRKCEWSINNKNILIPIKLEELDNFNYWKGWTLDKKLKNALEVVK